MSDKQWELPSTPEAFERSGERFRVATAVLKDMNDWLDRKGMEPPLCICERAEQLGMTPDAYYAFYKSLPFLDQRASEEQHALEDAAIHKVQPEWRRNPNPVYPKRF